MRIALFLIFLVKTFNLSAQSLNLTELENFYRKNSYSDREEILTNKGFSFESNTEYSDGTGTHMTRFVKGEIKIQGNIYDTEALIWTFEMSSKIFT